MKTLKTMLILATVAMVAFGCGPKKPKTLVLYYSQTSNTKAVAQEIAKRLHVTPAAISQRRAKIMGMLSDVRGML